MKKIKDSKKYKSAQKQKAKREKKKNNRTKTYLQLLGPSKGHKENIGLLQHERRLIDRKKFPLHEFLNEKGNQVKEESGKVIRIPTKFVLEKHHTTSFNSITHIRKAIFQYQGDKLRIDFSRCKEIDYSCIFLVLVILLEYLDFLEKIDKNLQILKTCPEVLIIPSKDDDVNAKLMAGYIIPNANVTHSFLKPFSALNFIKGEKARKGYLENLKGPAATTIRNYINENLKNHSFKLDDKNAAYLDGIISEILNNAEDHSEFNTWYVSGNIFQSESKDNNKEELVSELNLAFLNFGYSIFDGFEMNKDKNSAIYEEMNLMFENVKSKMNPLNSFSKEEMFTLYALQEGISRLNYKTEDRGTGTMKILKSFIHLGDYVNEEKGIKPSLLIYSGRVFLKCDHEFRPKKINGIDVLGLNKKNDLTELPEKSHLKKLDNPFPGTFLVVKIYLNKKQLQSKLA